MVKSSGDTPHEYAILDLLNLPLGAILLLVISVIVPEDLTLQSFESLGLFVSLAILYHPIELDAGLLELSKFLLVKYCRALTNHGFVSSHEGGHIIDTLLHPGPTGLVIWLKLFLKKLNRLLKAH